MRIKGYYFTDCNFTWICVSNYTIYTIVHNTGEWACRRVSKERFMETLAETTDFGEFTLKD